MKVACWSKKKEDNLDNLFVGATLCGEVSESNNN